MNYIHTANDSIFPSVTSEVVWNITTQFKYDGKTE